MNHACHYAQAIELKVNHPNFIQNFMNLMFSEEYQATRSYPSPKSRSPKPPMPIQLDAFLNTYISKHIQDKMSRKAFLKR